MAIPVSRLLYRLLATFGFPVVWEVSAGTVIFRRLTDQGREYLLLHYPSGHFDFAKGHVEAGETREEAAQRETQEETGITDITIFPHQTSIKYFYVARGAERERREKANRGTWIFKEVHFYPAETKERAVTLSHEHVGSVWLPYEAALLKVTFDNAKRVLTTVETYLKNMSRRAGHAG